jgi:hypothetical protein
VERVSVSVNNLWHVGVEATLRNVMEDHPPHFVDFTVGSICGYLKRLCSLMDLVDLARHVIFVPLFQSQMRFAFIVLC